MDLVRHEYGIPILNKISTMRRAKEVPNVKGKQTVSKKGNPTRFYNTDAAIVNVNETRGDIVSAHIGKKNPDSPNKSFGSLTNNTPRNITPLVQKGKVDVHNPYLTRTSTKSFNTGGHIPQSEIIKARWDAPWFEQASLPGVREGDTVAKDAMNITPISQAIKPVLPDTSTRLIPEENRINSTEGIDTHNLLVTTKGQQLGTNVSSSNLIGDLIALPFKIIGEIINALTGATQPKRMIGTQG